MEADGKVELLVLFFALLAVGVAVLVGEIEPLLVLGAVVSLESIEALLGLGVGMSVVFDVTEGGVLGISDGEGVELTGASVNMPVMLFTGEVSGLTGALAIPIELGANEKDGAGDGTSVGGKVKSSMIPAVEATKG